MLKQKSWKRPALQIEIESSERAAESLADKEYESPKSVENSPPPDEEEEEVDDNLFAELPEAKNKPEMRSNNFAA